MNENPGAHEQERVGAGTRSSMGIKRAQCCQSCLSCANFGHPKDHSFCGKMLHTQDDSGIIRTAYHPGPGDHFRLSQVHGRLRRTSTSVSFDSWARQRCGFGMRGFTPYRDSRSQSLQLGRLPSRLRVLAKEGRLLCLRGRRHEDSACCVSVKTLNLVFIMSCVIVIAGSVFSDIAQLLLRAHVVRDAGAMLRFWWRL